MRSYISVCIAVSMLAVVGFTSWLSNASIREAQERYDLVALGTLLETDEYDNELLKDVVLLAPDQMPSGFVNLELLGLQKPRLAYIAKKANEVVYVVIPATAEDGFNGFVDLLVAMDMFGRIRSVRIVRSFNSGTLYGSLSVIPSQWIELFSDKTFRDFLRLSWTKIPADSEYDLLVGASVTPKTISAKIYDTLLFFQSNRIAFIDRANSDDI